MTSKTVQHVAETVTSPRGPFACSYLGRASSWMAFFIFICLLPTLLLHIIVLVHAWNMLLPPTLDRVWMHVVLYTHRPQPYTGTCSQVRMDLCAVLEKLRFFALPASRGFIKVPPATHGQHSTCNDIGKLEYMWVSCVSFNGSSACEGYVFAVIM